MADSGLCQDVEKPIGYRSSSLGLVLTHIFGMTKGDYKSEVVQPPTSVSSPRREAGDSAFCLSRGGRARCRRFHKPARTGEEVRQDQVVNDEAWEGTSHLPRISCSLPTNNYLYFQ
jgi:hypothetical protein